MPDNKEVAVSQPRKKSLEIMADRLNLEPGQVMKVLKETVFSKANDSEFMALVVIANEYQLNPLIKQIFAFPSKRGGVEAMVPIDGWIAIINRQKGFNGLETQLNHDDDGKPVSCTCMIHVKDRDYPTVVTEYLEECRMPSDPWKNMPRRMLRHKAIIQCARVAFGLSGIYDEDEIRNIAVDSTPYAPPTESPSLLGDAEEKPKERAAPKTAAAKKTAPSRTQAKAPALQVDDEPDDLQMESDTEIIPPRKQLETLMAASNVSEDQVVMYCIEIGNSPDDASTVDDLKDKHIMALVANWTKTVVNIQEMEA